MKVFIKGSSLFILYLGMLVISKEVDNKIFNGFFFGWIAGLTYSVIYDLIDKK